MTEFRVHANLALSVLAAPYTPGDGIFVLVDAGPFRNSLPTVSNPLAITVAARSSAFSPQMSLANATIYLVTGITGNNLYLAGPQYAAESSTDRPYQPGDYAFSAPTAGDLDALQSAVNLLESQPALPPAGAPGSVLTTDGAVPAWSPSVDCGYW